ncbi:type II secretion system protein [Sutterella sp.]|uniref:type II secretion system protein n=1 Tax=Sutterella sp. TaxID=1981025 RepID=UPI003FD8943D
MIKAYSKNAQSKRGFTLLECVVTLVIAGFIGAVVTATMAYGVRIYQALRTQSAGTSQVHVAAAVVKRVVEKTKLENLDKVKSEFPREGDTVYWKTSGEKSVFLESVSSWEISSESVGSSNRKVVRLVTALQGSGSGEIVYEFHPLWEAD